jgi:outer membrane protein OmpA-like peptidoglycan-associated protein
MRHKALVLALLSATAGVPVAAHAADDNICSQLLIYAINQFCQLLPNGQSLCQPVALAGPSPSCESPNAQASMVQVPVGPPEIQFPALPAFGGAQNYVPPGAFPQFPYPQFQYPQFPYPQIPYPQFPVAQFPYPQLPQPPALPVFPYPDYPNPYFPFAAYPYAPPALPQYAMPAVPAVAATTQPSMPSAADSSPSTTATTTPITPATEPPTPVQASTAPVVTVEAPPTVATIILDQPAITPADSPATSVVAPSATPAPDSAPIATIADTVMPTSAADQAAAAEKALQDALAHFEFDSAVLTPRGRAMLDEWLTQATSDKPILVTGHADRLGPEPYNEKLSLLRAEAVKQYLTEKGKAPQRIEIKAKGEKLPLIDCTGDATPETKACLAPNRRAEVTFKPLAKPAKKAVKPLSTSVKPAAKR